MTVTTVNTIELNGYKYKTKGNIVGSWLDPFPESIAIGDADYANRRDLSSWTIQDISGGIGVEEMDEKKDWNKCWWTNCIIKFRNHILPPRLATVLANPAADTAAWVSPTSASGWNDSANAIDDNTATFARTTGTVATVSWSDYLTMPHSTSVKTCSKIRVYSVDAYTTEVSAYYGGAWHVVGSGAVTPNDWTEFALTTSQTVTSVRLRRYNSTGGSIYLSIYEVDSYDNAPAIGSAAHGINFNGKLYWALGAYLVKMNAGRTAFTIVRRFPANITALIPSLNSRLYIYLGDTNYYWWMATDETCTESTSAEAYWGFQHDAKLFKCNTSGTVKYSTDPDGAAPTWTTAGAITDIAAQIEGFVVGRDAGGNYVPYAATNSIIKVYDSTTPQWIDTEARLPNHPIGGQGHSYWNGKLYFSYGLAVKEYYPETGAFLDIGLTERDGLPIEYNSEIVKLLGDTGVKGMFAAFDASKTSGNSKSGIYLYDGFGWQCWWVSTSNNGAMYDIIVSSASSGYAVYWDCGGVIYYIDIPRGIENPDKISQSYATAGIFISPWFDAGNPVAAKLAKLLTDYAKGITATETVALKYRIDHTNTDLDTGWTTMDTLNTTGESGYNEELFASGAGISYKAIQFRLDFVTPGSTAKPDIQSMVFYFRKRVGSEKLQTWSLTVICDDYSTTSAKQKVANLKSAIESPTDVLFSYHPNDASDESHYVTVNCPSFSQETGRSYESNYQLQLIKSR